MARRGDDLREHILFAAKDVFLEMGFERTTMDAVASRAATSKRSLYAHFENKERLFLAVINLVRGLFLERVQRPQSLSEDPAQALTLFCGRYLDVLLYQSQVRMIRISTSEAERFPDQAAEYFDVLFTQVQQRISEYLREVFALSEKDSDNAAHTLLRDIVYPRLVRALFGMEALPARLSPDARTRPGDLKSIRDAIDRLLKSIHDSTVEVPNRIPDIKARLR